MSDTYKIVRVWFDGKHRQIKSGLSLEAAQAHCKDPKTAHTDHKDMKKSWMDVFYKE